MKVVTPVAMSCVQLVQHLVYCLCMHVVQSKLCTYYVVITCSYVKINAPIIIYYVRIIILCECMLQFSYVSVIELCACMQLTFSAHAHNELQQFVCYKSLHRLVTDRYTDYRNSHNRPVSCRGLKHPPQLTPAFGSTCHQMLLICLRQMSINHAQSHIAMLYTISLVPRLCREF